MYSIFRSKKLTTFFFIFKRHEKKAFTLIELLVVIAIIGILSGLIVVSMSGIVNSANDARGKENIDTIRRALVIYGTLNGMTYPVSTTQCTMGGGASPCSLPSSFLELLPNIPQNPTSGYYTYVSDSTGSNFILSGDLSNSSLSYNNKTGYATGAVDVDGNHYGAVTIGIQTWMTSNLMTTHYRDGTAITRGSTVADWDGADHGYYAYPSNASNTAEETLVNIQSNKLGFVYQWSAATNPKGICPSGWHVPSDAELCTLEQSVDSSITCGSTAWRGANGGLLLKEAGSTHWNSGNLGTNASGFSALAAGFRGSVGQFGYRNSSIYLWSSTASGVSAWYRQLYYSFATVWRDTALQAIGYSVRCLKD